MTTPAANPGSWIVKPAPNAAAKLRLFAIPFAGANASLFRLWPDGLPREVELCAVQLPGRQERGGEAPFTRMPLLVRALEEAVRPHADLPFVLFGSCTGSFVAFELTRRFLRRGHRLPVRLITSCCRAPHLPDRDAPIHRLDEDALLAELDRLGGTPQVVIEHPELMAMLLRVLRADFELAETYEYREQGPLDCPISVYGGIDDDIVADFELEGWAAQTTGACEVAMLPGGHYLVESSPEALVAAIADTLSRDVAALQARPTSRAE